MTHLVLNVKLSAIISVAADKSEPLSRKGVVQNLMRMLELTDEDGFANLVDAVEVIEVRNGSDKLLAGDDALGRWT